MLSPYNAKRMKAMILAAGFGTRLLPITETCPKPLVKVADKPLLEHQIGWLKHAGIHELVINLHHLGDMIEARIGDGSRFGVRIRYSREQTLLDSGGGIAKALPLLGDAPFICMLGDIWCPDMAFPRMLPRAALAHLILCPMHGRRDYGDFDLVQGKVIRDAHRPFIFTGVALLRPHLFDGCPKAPFSMTRDLLFRKLGSGQVTGEIHRGDWADIGSLESLSALRSRVAV